VSKPSQFFQFLTLLVVPPPHDRLADILLLPFLGSSATQYDYMSAIVAEINSVSGAEINLAFTDSYSNGFAIGKVTLLDAGNCRANLRRCASILVVEPLGERTSSLSVEVFSNFDPAVW